MITYILATQFLLVAAENWKRSIELYGDREYKLSLLYLVPFIFWLWIAVSCLENRWQLIWK